MTTTPEFAVGDANRSSSTSAGRLRDVLEEPAGRRKIANWLLGHTRYHLAHAHEFDLQEEAATCRRARAAATDHSGRATASKHERLLMKLQELSDRIERNTGLPPLERSSPRTADWV